MSKKFTTPAATCEWPKLQTPDCYQAKGDETDVYKYSVKMLFSDGDPKWQAFLETLEAAAADAWAAYMATQKKKRKMPNPPFSLADKLDDEGNETGMKTLSFNCRGRWWKDGTEKSRQLPLFGPDNKPFQAEGVLGNGTTLKVSFELSPYVVGSNAGVSLQLRAAKIIVPRYFGGSADRDFEDDETTAEDFDIAGESMPDSGGDY